MATGKKMSKPVNPVTQQQPKQHPAQQQHWWISVILVAGHVLETALQIYLCYHYWQLTTRWAAGLAALLAATVAVINAASIVGVRRGLDFADRWFGQCLCYVMHLSLLGMVWRFLKLTFLYDRTDLREFALLRFVQVCITLTARFFESDEKKPKRKVAADGNRKLENHNPRSFRVLYGFSGSKQDFSPHVSEHE